MTHDPLCEWSTPCIHGENQKHSRDTENPSVPDATYCWMCGVDCECALIDRVIAAAVQRVEAMTPAIYTPIGHPHEGCPDPSRHMTWEPAFTIPDILAAIKGDHP